MFGKVFLSATLLAVVDAVQFDNTDFSGITAGMPFNITWSGADGPVDLILKTGPATAQTVAGPIASGLTGTYYLWTPTASGTFNLEISSGGTINYSAQFPVTGGTALDSFSSVSATGNATTNTEVTTSATTSTSSTMSISSITTLTATNNSTAASSTISSDTGSMTILPIGSNSTTTVASTARTPTASHSTSTPTSINGAAQHASSFALAVIALGAFVAIN